MSATRLDIVVVPGARKTQIVGLHNQKLKLKVHAPPVDGKANIEIIAFFAGLLNCKKNQIEIIRGEKSRQKTLLIGGLSQKEVNVILDQELSKSKSIK